MVQGFRRCQALARSAQTPLQVGTLAEHRREFLQWAADLEGQRPVLSWHLDGYVRRVDGTTGGLY
jgi:hypothetical protein